MKNKEGKIRAEKIHLESDLKDGKEIVDMSDNKFARDFTPYSEGSDTSTTIGPDWSRLSSKCTCDSNDFDIQAEGAELTAAQIGDLRIRISAVENLAPASLSLPGQFLSPKSEQHLQVPRSRSLSLPEQFLSPNPGIEPRSRELSRSTPVSPSAWKKPALAPLPEEGDKDYVMSFSDLSRPIDCLGDDALDSPKRQASGSFTPMSAQSSVSCSHIERWANREETLIILDWDDTICPTTYASSLNNVIEESLPAWEAHLGAVRDLLRVANAVGCVTIVTMATKAWITHWISVMQLDELLEELGVRIIVARDIATSGVMKQSGGDYRNPSHFLKMNAMSIAAREFYGKGCAAPRSWKNLVSIGDSEAERLALQDLVFRRQQRDRRGAWKECRAKTVLFMDRPGLSELTTQVILTKQLLGTLVHHDGDLELDFDGDDFVFSKGSPICHDGFEIPN